MKSGQTCWLATTLTWSALACACNQESGMTGDSPAPTMPALCGGGSELSLTATFHSTAPSPEEERFATDRGHRFLLVNADCEYWVNEQSWFTRRGVLADEMMSELVTSLRYDELPALDGTWRAVCYDPSELTVSAVEWNVTCQCDCTGPGMPAEVESMAQGFWALLPKLAKQGADWSGPAKVLVLEDGTLEDQDALPWPASVALEDVLQDWDSYRSIIQNGLEVEGVSLDTTTAELFRELMVEYATLHPDRAVAGNPLPLFDGNKYYGVYLRDELASAQD